MLTNDTPPFESSNTHVVNWPEDAPRVHQGLLISVGPHLFPAGHHLIYFGHQGRCKKCPNRFRKQQPVRNATFATLLGEEIGKTYKLWQSVCYSWNCHKQSPFFSYIKGLFGCQKNIQHYRLS